MPSSGNRWSLGGRLTDRYREEIDDRGLANVLTLERGDGSRYEHYLFGDVADRASEIERHEFLVLEGGVSKHRYVPDGADRPREATRFDVSDLRRVEDERTANINRGELDGVIVDVGRLIPGEDGRPLCRLKLRHESFDFVFDAKGRVALSARALKIGRFVVIETRFSAKPRMETNPSGRWRIRQDLIGFSVADHPTAA